MSLFLSFEMEFENPVLPDWCDSENEIQDQGHRSHSVNIPSFLLCTPALCSQPLVTHKQALRSLPTAPCWKPQLLQELIIYFSFFQGSLCFAPPPQFWGLPKWAGTECSVGYQRLLLNLLASTPNSSLHVSYEGALQVLEPTYASCIVLPLVPKSISKVKRPGSDLSRE